MKIRIKNILFRPFFKENPMRIIISDIPDITCPPGATLITDKGNIRPCIGCFGCWVKTPGRCVLRDGYESLGELFSQCDRLDILSRCTYGSLSPFVKNVIDRAISYNSPHFTLRNGELHHKRRYKNVITVNAYFYGDTTEDEQQLARRIVKANMVNFDGIVGDVSFFDSADAAKEAVL